MRSATFFTPFFRDTETDRLQEEIIEVEVGAETEDLEDLGTEDLLAFLREIDLQRKGKIQNPINLLLLGLNIFLCSNLYILGLHVTGPFIRVILYTELYVVSPHTDNYFIRY